MYNIFFIRKMLWVLIKFNYLKTNLIKKNKKTKIL